MASRRSGIFCVEGPWGKSTDKSSVRPLLELLDGQNLMPFIHRDAATVAKLEHYLNTWTYKQFANFDLGYLAFHGDRGLVEIDRKRYMLERLGEFLAGRLAGRTLHFADPSTRQLLAGAEPTVGRDQPGRVGRGTGRLGSRSQDLRNRLGALALPAFNADEVAGRWDEMGLAGRRAILARVFERIEVRRPTTRGYDPERIKLTWCNPDVAAAVTAPPGAPEAHRD
jgi:hypothetical protein